MIRLEHRAACVAFPGTRTLRLATGTAPLAAMPEQLLLDMPLAPALRLRRHAGVIIMPASIVNESAELIAVPIQILARKACASCSVAIWRQLYSFDDNLQIMTVCWFAIGLDRSDRLAVQFRDWLGFVMVLDHVPPRRLRPTMIAPTNPRPGPGAEHWTACGKGPAYDPRRGVHGRLERGSQALNPLPTVRA